MDERDVRRRTAAKIPGPDTGIEVRRTVCNVCCSSFYCGLDAYVKDGRIIKVEGAADHPLNHGLLCTKGLATREYIYSPRRIKTPLKRAGARGEGKFIPITWEEAYAEIAAHLNRIKEEDGPEAVAFSAASRSGIRRFCTAWPIPSARPTTARTTAPVLKPSTWPGSSTRVCWGRRMWSMPEPIWPSP